MLNIPSDRFRPYVPVCLSLPVSENQTVKCTPLPKYKVSAARLRLIFAARLPQTRFSYANFFSGALFWPTMCAARMQRTVVAHCSGTQCAPQVCGAQLSRTILAHNVRCKFAAHSCGTLFLCATTLQRTVAVHWAVLPPPTPLPPPCFIIPTVIFFLVPYPQGECEKKCGDCRSVTKNKNMRVGVGKNVGAGGW